MPAFGVVLRAHGRCDGRMRLTAILASILALFGVGWGQAAGADEAGVSAAVGQVIPALMRRRAYREWRSASPWTATRRSSPWGHRPDNEPAGLPETLFEVGSVTKTFTATLTAFAREKGALSLSDPVERFLPELRGTPSGAVKLRPAGDPHAGRAPAPGPASVQTLNQMFGYLRAWRPAAAAGTLRTYSNPGVGALGLVAARGLGRDFGPLVEGDLLPGLGLHRTYLRVPAGRQAAYAQGHSSVGAPVRLTPGVFWEEAYGIKSTVGSLLLFLDENMGVAPLGDPNLARAVEATQTGYFRVGPMTQDLMWEQYAMPVALETLLEGNAAELILKPTPATALVPPLAPGGDVWINKTGSTSGFGAYLAFVPRDRLGIVLLANKNYPIPDRIRAAFAISGAVEDRPMSDTLAAMSTTPARPIHPRSRSATST